MSEAADEIRIRAREPEDLPGVTELLSQPRVIWGTAQLPFTSLDARRARGDGGPLNTHIVAVAGGRIVGHATLHRNENPRRAHAASIGIAVHDDHAGRGIGAALMAALTDQADRWLNISRLELTVFADNRRAIALYERFGFEPEGVHRAHCFRDGVLVDTVTMARLRAQSQTPGDGLESAGFP